MEMAHFYHVWAGGHWWEPLSEHLIALSQARFPAPCLLSVVGDPRERVDVREFIKLSPHMAKVEAEFDQGWEGKCLDLIQEWAQQASPDSIVLYAHAKGSFTQSEFQAKWRRGMTHDVVAGWQFAVPALRSADVVAAHWMTPEHDWVLPSGIKVVTDRPYASGGYWWATARYLKTLGPAPDGHYEPEFWIGSGNPRALSLREGPPTLYYG